MKRIQEENHKKNNIKKHVECLEESIKYFSNVLQNINDKFLKLVSQRFETHNEIVLKNLQEKKKSNKVTLQNMKLEIQEIKEMYEKKLELKDQEIKTISDNYKKKLYENFNAKVSRDIHEIENEELPKKNQQKKEKNEDFELKCKIIEHENKVKKYKKKQQNKKEKFEEMNMKFYELRR